VIIRVGYLEVSLIHNAFQCEQYLFAVDKWHCFLCHGRERTIARNFCVNFKRPNTEMNRLH